MENAHGERSGERAGNSGAAGEAGTPATLGSAVDRLRRLKGEHGPLLARIAADPGMTPETRAALIAHLYEEEDQAVERIAGALPAETLARDPAKAAAASAPARKAAGLTVGSLRAPADLSSAPARVGSLRRR